MDALMPPAPPDPLLLSLTGLLIVFVVLGLIVLAVSGMRRLDERWQALEREKEQQALERPPGIDSITLVLIGAAVATLVEGRFRIRSVRRLMRTGAPSSMWSQHGRAALQGSHVVSRKRSER